MKKIKEFLLQYKYLCVLSLSVPLYLWFNYCERHVVPKYIMHTALDDKIPFVKVFVIPYLFWYVFILFALIYTYKTNKEDYMKLIIFLGAGMAICYSIYMLFPNAENLRPVITQNDWFSRTIKNIYATDTPTDVCPSIHVLNSVAVQSALYNSESFRKKKYAVKISFVIMFLICMSTMFIKQHSVIDVFCALVLSLLFYISLYAVPNVMHAQLAYGNIKISE